MLSSNWIDHTFTLSFNKLVSHIPQNTEEWLCVLPEELKLSFPPPCLQTPTSVLLDLSLLPVGIKVSQILPISLMCPWCLLMKTSSTSNSLTTYLGMSLNKWEIRYQLCYRHEG